jgi:hypothetical protein
LFVANAPGHERAGGQNHGVRRSIVQLRRPDGGDMHGCQGIGEMPYQMRQGRVKDAGKIQAAVDAKWAPKG